VDDVAVAERAHARIDADADAGDIVERLAAVLAAGDVVAMDELFDHSYRDNDPLPGLPGDLDGLRALTAWLHANATNLRVHLEDHVVAGDRAAYRLFVSGEAIRDNRPEIFLATSVGFARLADGRIAERWGPWTLTYVRR